MTEEDYQAKPLSHVLREEQAQIRLRRGSRDTADSTPSSGDSPVDQSEASQCESAYGEALDLDLAGLSFSGGGIRSATFNLGVLQALASLGLLKHFDYLSTVSGGGYIGSWLSALYHRLGKNEDSDPQEQVEAFLTGRQADGAVDAKSSPTKRDPIRFLRRYSNYLTPSVGILTADTWAVVATYARNLLLNLLVLTSTFAAAMMIPRLFLFFPRVSVHPPWAEEAGTPVSMMLPMAGLLTFLAVCFIGYNLGHACEAAQRRPKDGSKSKVGVGNLRAFLLGKGGVQWMIVLPLLIAAFLATVGLQEITVTDKSLFILVVTFVYFVSWLVAACFSRLTVQVSLKDVQWVRQIVWSPIAGLVGSSLLLAIQGLLGGDPELRLDVWQGRALGPPLILLLFVATAALHTGLVGRQFHDYFREWLSRVGAWLLIYSLGWAALFCMTVYAPPFVAWLSGGLRSVVTISWLGTTLAGLLANRGRAKGKGVLFRIILIKVAPYVFIAGFLLWISVGIDFAISHYPSPGLDLTTFKGYEEAAQQAPDFSIDELTWMVLGHTQSLCFPSGKLTLGLFLSLALVGLVLSYRVDVNEFSMHRLYRNRLVRCYLGASVDPDSRDDIRNPFTGFSHKDDIPLSSLKALTPEPKQHGPYHIINAALNLVGGSELAWQERKADSFVFTPLYSGFTPEDLSPAYRSNQAYGSDPKPLTLGSALAISGAAASPNMGFRSSPALAFLLTVFNVRLGWWLGNPRSESGWRESGPRFGLMSLLREVFGLTTDKHDYVYLSDGGHFENLGVFELVRRRCRFILACDAGQDTSLSFDDLGNAIRKCRIDLGVEVELRPEQIRLPSEGGFSAWHCAVGRIHYDRITPGGGKGLLLYLKPSLTGDEPEDVLNYASQNEAFPHQTTADQWFGESQFESYRRLGKHVAIEALETAVKWAKAEGGTFNFERFLQRLDERWYPPTGVKPGAFSRHGATLDQIFERLGNSKNLSFLHAQFYPEWSSLQQGEPTGRAPIFLPSGQEERTQGFYFCNSLIQLMENVYLDLNFEEHHAHPENRGWMNLFMHWSWSGMFRLTWSISAATYGHRFQNFCQYRLGLDIVDGIRLVDIGQVDGIQADKGLREIIEMTDLLNFHERNLILEILAKSGSEASIDRVISLQVVVANLLDPDANKEAKSVNFGCGFLLIKGGGIAGYRIQDHLRKMGLGRRGLLAWGKMKGADKGEGIPVSLAVIPEDYADEFPPSGRRQFHRLVRSVERELGGSR